MKKIIPLMFALVFASGNIYADPVLNEETVEAISEEMTQAVLNNDFSVIEKYMYPGSEIIIDMDPAPGRGETKIEYDEYMKLTKMSMGMMKNPVIDNEILSIKIDGSKNEATIEEKTTAVMEMMGMKMRDVSISKTTYGVVNGEIKVLTARDQLISSGPVN